ncbi:MAG: hypothetical protein J7J20_01280 [Desulfurococcales archaeon]|nr:hypothetical protein [Desulfurococcales archaeon]
MEFDLKEVLTARSGLKEVMGDVLRVLYLFSGTLWLPELITELSGFKRTLGEEGGIPKKNKVEDAVNLLNMAGLVSVRPGIRATASSRGEKTLLISLTRRDDVLSHLSSDEKVRKYHQAWRDALSGIRR